MWVALQKGGMEVMVQVVHVVVEIWAILASGNSDKSGSVSCHGVVSCVAPRRVMLCHVPPRGVVLCLVVSCRVKLVKRAAAAFPANARL